METNAPSGAMKATSAGVGVGGTGVGVGGTGVGVGGTGVGVGGTGVGVGVGGWPAQAASTNARANKPTTRKVQHARLDVNILNSLLSC
jgi:hypothetical protein